MYFIGINLKKNVYLGKFTKINGSHDLYCLIFEINFFHVSEILTEGHISKQCFIIGITSA